MSIIKDEKIEVLDKKLVKLFKSYPVYEKEYEIKLRAIIDKYDSIDNFIQLEDKVFQLYWYIRLYGYWFWICKMVKNQTNIETWKVREIELISIQY